MGPGFFGSLLMWQTMHWPWANGGIECLATSAGKGLRAAPRFIAVRFSSVRSGAAPARGARSARARSTAARTTTLDMADLPPARIDGPGYGDPTSLARGSQVSG